MSRPQRLFDLLSVLRAQGKTTVSDLAADLDVSERTIHRDLATLSEVGVPVVTEPGRYGGVALLPGGRFTVSGLSSREKDLLHAVGLDVDRATQLGQEAVVKAAVGKLRSTSGSESFTSALPMSQVVMIDNRPWFSAPTKTGVDVAELAEAVRTGQRLQVNYRRNGEAEPESRIVAPYGLLGRGGRWYLVVDRDRVARQYAVERMEGWQVLDEPRRLRPGITLENVVDALSEGLERPRETIAVTAELDLQSVDMAKRIVSSRLVSVEPGELVATITIAYEHIEGVRQLLQFAEHIRVTGPQEAVDLMARLASKIVGQHSTKDADLP